ncbi:MAG: tetratricopeptide repeat protein [Thermodesulfobacteriota bacterium]
MNSRSRPRTTSSIASFVRRPLLLWLLLPALLAAACAVDEEIVVPPEQLNAYLSDKPPQLRPLYERVLREGDRNMVLNQMQAGLAAMEEGEYRLAEESFDQALLGIEAVYANNEKAEKARGLWRKEGAKDFKGEPYERAMAYYYRGLLYLRKGDYENARACFKSGIMQDAFAEEEQYQCDFALLIFLEGWASQQLGAMDLAREAYKELKTFRPDFAVPPEDHNCLILVETGLSPVKVAAGEHESALTVARGEGFPEERARVSVGKVLLPVYAMESIYFQASTRGGRAFDAILQGKVRFKETSDTVGTVMQTAGLAAMKIGQAQHNRDLQAVGAVVAILGTASRVMAAMVRTEADVRYWGNLPDLIHVLTARMLPPGAPAPSPKPGQPAETFVRPGDVIQASFLDQAGREMTGLRRRAQINLIETGPSGWGWIRSRSALTTAIPQ